MHIPSSILTVLIAAAVSAVCCDSVVAADHQATDLAWLEGCWAHEDGGTQEYWIDTGHGLLFGHSVTIGDAGLAAFEDLRIEPGAAGPAYVASPGGRAPIAFQYADSGASSIAFENPDHDFPQRIAYQRKGDRLTATISTLDRSQQIDFAMTACAPTAGGSFSGRQP